MAIVCFSLTRHEVMKCADVQSSRPQPCVVAKQCLSTCLKATIKTSSSVTRQRRPGDHMPPGVYAPQERPRWSWAVSRHKPCCSGSLAGTHWQPEIHKDNTAAQTSEDSLITPFQTRASPSVTYLYHIKAKQAALFNVCPEHQVRQQKEEESYSRKRHKTSRMWNFRWWNELALNGYVCAPGAQQNKMTIIIFLAVENTVLNLLLERPSPSTGKSPSCSCLSYHLPTL